MRINISKELKRQMTNPKWQPTNYQKDRLISNTKKYIKQKLDEQ